MKSLILYATLTLFVGTSTVYAGGLAPAIVESTPQTMEMAPAIIASEAATNSASGAAIIIPLVLLALIVFATSSSGSSVMTGGTIVPDMTDIVTAPEVILPIKDPALLLP